MNDLIDVLPPEYKLKMEQIKKSKKGMQKDELVARTVKLYIDDFQKAQAGEVSICFI
jgi:hypothetical protein